VKVDNLAEIETKNLKFLGGFHSRANYMFEKARRAESNTTKINP